MYLYSKLRFLHVTFFKKLQDGGSYGGSGRFLFLVATYMRVFDFIESPWVLLKEPAVVWLASSV